jgi:hypothetical protein
LAQALATAHQTRLKNLSTFTSLGICATSTEVKIYGISLSSQTAKREYGRRNIIREPYGKRNIAREEQ